MRPSAFMGVIEEVLGPVSVRLLTLNIFHRLLWAIRAIYGRRELSRAPVIGNLPKRPFIWPA